jgi:hypothetical protein
MSGDIVADLRSAARKVQMLKEMSVAKGASLTTLRRLVETSERAADALSTALLQVEALTRALSAAHHLAAKARDIRSSASETAPADIQELVEATSPIRSLSKEGETNG